MNKQRINSFLCIMLACLVYMPVKAQQRDVRPVSFAAITIKGKLGHSRTWIGWRKKSSMLMVSRIHLMRTGLETFRGGFAGIGTRSPSRTSGT